MVVQSNDYGVGDRARDESERSAGRQGSVNPRTHEQDEENKKNTQIKRYKHADIVCGNPLIPTLLDWTEAEQSKRHEIQN